GSVLRDCEAELAKVVALSFFIPLIIGTGGNAGSQTVSTIIRALALGQIRLRDGWRVLLRETSSGFFLGALLCVFAVLRTLLWKSGPQLALVVGLTILCVCAWANIIGSIVPLLAQRRAPPAIENPSRFPPPPLDPPGGGRGRAGDSPVGAQGSPCCGGGG